LIYVNSVSFWREKVPESGRIGVRDAKAGRGRAWKTRS
jgi:hypothetical protein